MTDYRAFLQSKRVTVRPSGLIVQPDEVHPMLFKYQNAITRRGLQLGKSAVFAECGLGKTYMYLSWADLVVKHTGGKVVILTPLAVGYQAVNMAANIGVVVKHCQSQEDVGDASIVVTNYERLHLFDPSAFVGVVLDESSILKNLGGKTFWQLVRAFADTPYKLCCTATPAPNDYVEFSNHSMFLGIMHFKEVLARWFTGDSKLARSAVLKKHAEKDWWRWLTSWAVSLSRPADLGDEYDMAGFDLPPLNILEHRLDASQQTLERTWAEGMLLPDSNPNSTTLHKVKRESLHDRVDKAIEIVSALPEDEPVTIWCDTNYEADALMKAFPKAIEVRGSHTPLQKELGLSAFSEGRERLMITKPDIAGFGLNWQHCANTVLVGVSFSFEKTYQALRRHYRFGQTRQVNAHMIYAETEGSVYSILQQKQVAFQEMQQKMNEAMHEHGLFRDDAAPALLSSEGHKPIYIPGWLKPHTDPMLAEVN